MPVQSKYESYRILQSRIKERGLFEDRPDSVLRIESLRAAITIGTQQDPDLDGVWIAGAVKEIDGGIMFKMARTQNVKNYRLENGEFEAFDERFKFLTDVIVEYANGLMLIRKDSTTPSAFLASKAFQRWLESENDRLGFGFSSIVQAIPNLDDFIVELEEAVKVSSMTFVVHGPNPEDEDDFLQQIAQFTEEHGISTTSVTIHADDIDRGTATRVAKAAGSIGNRVSAMIQDRAGRNRPIRTQKKANTFPGPKDPSPDEATGLIGILRRIVDRVGVKRKDEDEQGID